MTNWPPTERVESRPERAGKSEFRRWEFAGFQGANPANPANTITLAQAGTRMGGWLQRSSRTTRYQGSSSLRIAPVRPTLLPGCYHLGFREIGLRIKKPVSHWTYGLIWLRGQDLNLRPSGYESRRKIAYHQEMWRTSKNLIVNDFPSLTFRVGFAQFRISRPRFALFRA